MRFAKRFAKSCTRAYAVAAPRVPIFQEQISLVSAQRAVHVHIAESELPLLVRGNVLLLRVAKRPDFVALNLLARKIAEFFSLKLFAGWSEPRHQPSDSILGCASPFGQWREWNCLPRVPLSLGPACLA